MKKLNVLGLAGAVVLLCAPVCDAHVLVYRMRLVGKITSEDSLGKTKSETKPSTESFLWFFDLDTDTWVASSGQSTSSESMTLITLNERTKTAKTFFHSSDVGEGAGENLSVHKFEFYSNTKKFYYFYFQTKDLGERGYDTGSILGQGGCKLNIKIGGGSTSPVPNDFMAALTRGDGGKLKKGVLSMKYDPAITVAVNDYLEVNAIHSAKGSGVSTAIPAATSWLISDYLPKNGYAQVGTP